ncbi:hypothetical protein [Rhodanobacter sp. FW106-PBR-LB-2-11]|uniref:hypothetical protein n=1 Tax=Rhodanobacter sp. FW106-PBR-LB-2-11 TaxID=1524463 RepID=UPI0034E56974
MNAQVALLLDRGLDAGAGIDLTRLAATWKAVEAISGENLRRSYERSGITLCHASGAVVVAHRGVPVATMTGRFSRRELFEQMIRWLHDQGARIGQTLLEAWEHLPIPPGHELVADIPSELRWLLAIRSNKVSVSVRPLRVRAADQARVHAELRVFLDEPRAILFIDREGGSAGRVDLLEGKERHVRAATYQELALLIAQQFARAIQRVDGCPERTA